MCTSSLISSASSVANFPVALRNKRGNGLIKQDYGEDVRVFPGEFTPCLPELEVKDLGHETGHLLHINVDWGLLVSFLARLEVCGWGTTLQNPLQLSPC